MNPIRLAVERPVATLALTALALLFGMVALFRIPVQLAPDVRRPVITVTTDWPGASPEEVEREILVRQEKALEGLEGLEEMLGVAEDGRAQLTLEFTVDTDIDRALVLVANRLSSISDLPDEADQPRLSTAGNEDNPIAWFVLTRAPGNDRPIHEYGDFARDVVGERLARVPGVAQVNVFGDAKRRLEVVVDPQVLAAHRLTVDELVSAIRASSLAATAGDVEEGKRRWIVRVEGELATPEELARLALRRGEGGRAAILRLGDIAEIRHGYSDPVARIRRMGEPALAINITRATGANVLRTMEGVREAVAELAAGPVAAQGLRLRQVYDETVYIESAIDLVLNNVWIGGLLATVVLLVFLRSPRATLVVALAIPVSVIAAFAVMALSGRTLNVISLAGLAFAVGMVVDAAIVVLENIFRLRRAGLAADEAAVRGAGEVWLAILVSTLTTVVVFVPVLALRLEVGQLFRDLAIAISAAVSISLVVAVTVVPSLARRLLAGLDPAREVHLPVIDRLAAGFGRAVEAFVGQIVRSRTVSALFVFALVAALGSIAWRLLPPLEYLPEGNRNLVFGVLQPPPGYNLATTFDIASRIEERLRPLMRRPDGTLPQLRPDDPPAIDDFFFVALRGAAFVGAQAADPQRAGELVAPLRRAMFAEPGTFGFASQPSIFGRGVGGGRVLRLDVTGPDLPVLLDLAGRITGMVDGVLPRERGTQLRPRPGLELGAPQLRLVPDRVRLADAGLSATSFARALDVFNDGLTVTQVSAGGDRIDLVLRGPDGLVRHTQDIARLPVVLPDGVVVPAGDLATVALWAGPVEIRRIDRMRTVSLEIRPPADVPLETAMRLLEDRVMAPLRAEGLPEGVALRLSGTADRLVETFRALRTDLLLAVAIVFLAMAASFESLRIPLAVMVAVPLGAAGGVLGLVVVDRLLQPQRLDMLTMLGFVILVGVVVNNAILLADRVQRRLAEPGADLRAALVGAVGDRLRPIFMTTLTSVFGMLPLVLAPGAGSELYRGIGAVVVGGLTLSSLLVLFTVPPLLNLVLPRRVPAEEPTAAPAADAGRA